jgi:hypothetical protein
MYDYGGGYFSPLYLFGLTAKTIISRREVLCERLEISASDSFDEPEMFIVKKILNDIQCLFKEEIRQCEREIDDLHMCAPLLRCSLHDLIRANIDQTITFKNAFGGKENVKMYSSHTNSPIFYREIESEYISIPLEFLMKKSFKSMSIYDFSLIYPNIETKTIYIRSKIIATQLIRFYGPPPPPSKEKYKISQEYPKSLKSQIDDITAKLKY